MKLFGYWRSSASYRVRIALNLKGIDVEHIPVNLRAGEQREDNYAKINPQLLVPTLEREDGTRLTQSAAIIEYLEETVAGPALLPNDPLQRARIRSVMTLIGADTAPIQNLRVLKYLKGPLDLPQETVDDWARHWIATGLTSLEKMTASSSSLYLYTETPTVAECFLIPQIYNARRYDIDMSAFPRLSEVEATCLALPAFDAARPENQADAPDE